jgi:methionyl-tRNA formyltransferase
MKIIFAGTPEFASVALAHLLRAGFEVPLVLTQPDRPAGRGMKLHASAVKQLAQQHGITVAQPRSLRLDGKYPEDAAAARQAIASAQADAMVVAAYGLILPQWVLDMLSSFPPGRPKENTAPTGLSAAAPILPMQDWTARRAIASGDGTYSAAHAVASVGAPTLGCFNIHASLLPRWRGAAPIHRAIEAGDAHTGITIMQMDAGLDTGDMLLAQSIAIAPTDTTTTLHDTLATLGGSMMVQVLQQAAAGTLKPVKQPEAGITYAAKIEKAEARINWLHSAEQIERRVRAFDPFPGCATQINGETVKVWRSQIDSCSRSDLLACGQIMTIKPEGISVQCGSGALLLTELQRAGGKRLPATEFLHGFELREGMQFEN